MNIDVVIAIYFMNEIGWLLTFLVMSQFALIGPTPNRYVNVVVFAIFSALWPILWIFMLADSYFTKKALDDDV
jgi:uncharacterized membrane protein